MARHRWATGERTSSPDRLDRVLNLKHAEPAPGTVPAWSDPLTAYDCPSDEGRGELIEPDVAPAGQPPAERRRPGRRWVATRRAALLAAGCALAVGGWQFVSIERVPPEVVPIEPPVSAASEGPPGVEPSAETSVPAGEEHTGAQPGKGAGGAPDGTVVVHVAGAVQEPGVVEAAAGSRVFEVLEKAGGPLPEAELSAVNLAAVVEDGQQILIPLAGETLQPVNPAPAPEPGSGGALVNLNTADAAGLEELPKVGPVLAERIVEWRGQHGPFARPEDLDAVPGIGPAMLEALLPLVTV